MHHLPETLHAWRTAASWDAAALSRKWHAAVAKLDPATRRAVLAHLPDEVELATAWEAATRSEGPLAGLPILVKDLFDQTGVDTTASSTFLPEVRPTPTRDSALVATVRATGAVLAGRTHLNEFAYGLSGENAHFGDVPCALDATRLSGGSSSGSAWAVGAGLVPFALGTDTGGSVRVPASFNGIWGLRLTPDHPLSHDGCFPLAPTFDTAGWFATNAEDLITLTDAILGPQTSGPASGPLRVMRLPDPFELATDVQTSYATTEWPFAVHDLPGDLAEGWRERVNALPPHFSVIQSDEALAIHAQWLDRYRDRYDPRTFARIERARHWTEDQRQAAQAAMVDFRAWFAENVWTQCDVALLPAVPCVAQPADHQGDATRNQILTLTAPASVTASPVVARPISGPEGLSLGWQMIARDVATARRVLAAVA